MEEIKYKTIIEFITEQNRLERTGGLAADHPDGGVVPWDVPLSSNKVAFLAREMERLRNMERERFKLLNR